MTERIFVGLADSRRIHGEHSIRVPILHIKDVRDGLLPGREHLDTRLVPEDADIDRYQIRARDVVVTCRGTQLRVGIAAPSTEGAIASANLIVIRTSEQLLPEILLAYLRTPEGQHGLRAAVSGTAILSLRPDDLGRLPIPILPLAQQHPLADLVQTAELYHRASIEAAERRRAMVQAALEHALRPAMEVA